MGVAEDRDQESSMDPELSARLATLEGLMAQMLKELRGRKLKGMKRARSVAARAVEHAESDELRYKPTELQRAAARRALRR